MESPILFACANYARKILISEAREKRSNSLANIFNLYCPEPVTILELAEIVRDAIVKYSDGGIELEQMWWILVSRACLVKRARNWLELTLVKH